MVAERGGSPSAMASGHARCRPRRNGQHTVSGTLIERKLAGLPDGQARIFLGSLLKSTGDDCVRVHRALREADYLDPADPVDWLFCKMIQCVVDLPPSTWALIHNLEILQAVIPGRSVASRA
jgi:hypothetical protein